MRCDQCEMVSINGHACHETGCPNSGKVWNADESAWETLFECHECGAKFTDRLVAAECCAPVDATEVNILSIDAWREGQGWHWNNWHKVGKFPLDRIDMKPRAMLKALREEFGILSPASRGAVAIEDDGYNIVILARGTGEPLYAIAYGEAQ